MILAIMPSLTNGPICSMETVSNSNAAFYGLPPIHQYAPFSSVLRFTFWALLKHFQLGLLKIDELFVEAMSSKSPVCRLSSGVDPGVWFLRIPGFTLIVQSGKQTTEYRCVGAYRVYRVDREDRVYRV